MGAIANRSLRFDLLLILGLLALCNLHLWIPGIDPQHCLPDRVAGGEWWRLVAHPFVHASFYHLAIDGLVFLLLFHALDGNRGRRWVAVGITSLGAILAVGIGEPEFSSMGYGGLSGAAHGLMVLLGLQIVASPNSRSRVGWALVVGVVAKSLVEVGGGDVVFATLHWGSVGTPLVWSHLGGAIAGLVLAAATIPRRIEE